MSATDPVAVTFFFLTTGLFIGMGHCLGMCGPIVVAFSLRIESKTAFVPHLLYHLGRITTYGILGAVTAMTGAFVGVTSAIADLQKWLLTATGLMLVVMGMGMMGWLPRLKRWMDGGDAGAFFSRPFKRLLNRRSAARFFLLGLLLGLLPCGPVYTALLAVAGAALKTGSPGQNALLGFLWMAAFGIGTAPSLLLLGKLAHSPVMKHRIILFRAGALLIILFGAFLTVQGIRF